MCGPLLGVAKITRPFVIRSIFTLIVATFLLMAFFSNANAAPKDLGVYGKTYSIAEKDALQEIKSRAKTVNWSKYFDKKKWEKRIKNYQPYDLVKIPKARQNRTYLVDMTYQLEFDIPKVDSQGNVVGILYPKGYTFNPLDYTSLPNTLIIFNGKDKNQLTWIKSSPYLKETSAMVLTTDGNWYDLALDLKVPVYFAQKALLSRLQVRAVPAVVYQEGNMMRIREINADEFVAQKNKSGS